MSTPLCVDLDGTLIHTDLLHEAIIRLLKQNPLSFFSLLMWFILGGKANLKQQLANHVALETSTLPYNQALLSWLKKQNRPIILVTAADQLYADAVANHLGIFDEVYASDGLVNLAGDQKENLLNQRFGEKQYDYIGNASPDLAVWRSANDVIVVSNSARLQQKIKKHNSITKTFSPPALTLKCLCKALRVHQYAKNGLLFIPLLAAHLIFHPALWGQALLGFISFSFIASSTYLINDVFDIDADRKHPHKKHRAIASGLISVSSAIQMALGLFVLAFVLAAQLPLHFSLVLITYYSITLCYSLYLKNTVLIDVMTLAVLYTIRIVAGMNLLEQGTYSIWLLLFSLFFFLSLAFLKRISELTLLKTSLAGRSYEIFHYTILQIFGVASGLLSVLIIALYLKSPEAARLYQSPQLLLLIFPILVYWIMRIWLLAVEGKITDDPVLFAIRDQASYYCGALIALTMFFSARGI